MVRNDDDATRRPHSPSDSAHSGYTLLGFQTFLLAVTHSCHAVRVSLVHVRQDAGSLTYDQGTMTGLDFDGKADGSH